MKQNLKGMYPFLKAGFKVTSLLSLCIYTFLRIIFWGAPFDLLEEISIHVKAVLCGNTLFVVFVLSFLLLERTFLYISKVILPSFLLLLKPQPESSVTKDIHTNLNNSYRIRNVIGYDEILVEEF